MPASAHKALSTQRLRGRSVGVSHLSSHQHKSRFELCRNFSIRRQDLHRAPPLICDPPINSQTIFKPGTKSQWHRQCGSLCCRVAKGFLASSGLLTSSTGGSQGFHGCRWLKSCEGVFSVCEDPRPAPAVNRPPCTSQTLKL